MCIANDKGHRHGFTQRAPQTQHDAADHADFGIGQHHIPHDFPGGCSQAVS